MNWAGWLSGDRPVAQTSATRRSTSSMPGRAWRLGRRRSYREAGRACPARRRRPPTAPRGGSGRSRRRRRRWRGPPGGRWTGRPGGPGRTCRGTGLRAARSCSIVSARSSPIVRTPDSPTRTAGPPSPHRCGGSPGPLPHRVSRGRLQVASASLALMSGRRTSTPCRRASSTSGLRRVEAHRLGVEQRGAEGGRVVALEPGAGVDEVGEAHRVALREAVAGERRQLEEDVVGQLAGDAALGHARVEPVADLGHPLGRPLGAHRPAQLVGLGRRRSRRRRWRAASAAPGTAARRASCPARSPSADGR